jgi:hypothetical protein
MGGYYGSRGGPGPHAGSCLSCGLQLEQLRAEQKALHKRVRVLEAREAITRFMYQWAKQADLIETEKEPSRVQHLIHELAYDMMTADGTCDFSAIPDWGGIWGPDKSDIINKFLNFAKPIGWAYHIYPNASIDVKLKKGIAHYYTSSEVVPLNLSGQDQLLFLKQDSTLRLVDGKWKMARYKLSKLRTVPLGPVIPPGTGP